MDLGNESWSPMNLPHEEKELADRFLKAMLEAALPLQADLDQEVTLQALIRAAEMLKNGSSEPSVLSS